MVSGQLYPRSGAPQTIADPLIFICTPVSVLWLLSGDGCGPRWEHGCCSQQVYRYIDTWSLGDGLPVNVFKQNF
jgi:hypothetical protein